MNRILILSLVVSIAFLSGCASKRYVKKGLKYEQAGMYELAAEMFYQSMVRNPKNIDAAIGLKKNGQRLMDDKILSIHQVYSAGNDKETVYKFLDAKAYRDKVNATGVQISYPERTEGFFNEAKSRYLSKLYAEARLLLDEEKFKDSEVLFSEIKSIDPSYKGVDEHMKISQCEPIYREGVDFLSTGFYRKAYANFNSIIVNHGSYKDSKELRDDALNKGMITIEIKPFTSKQRLDRPVASMLESKITTSITSLKNPFIKIVDTQNTQAFIQQQQQTHNTNVQIGKLLAAKALLTGEIIRLERTSGELQKTEKRGYLKEEKKVKDKTTGEEKIETEFHKVTYFEFTRENIVKVSFKYQLSSTETASVLVSDEMDINANDNIHYAEFEGKMENLIPGYWEFADKKSPKDKINDNQSDINKLQSLLKASKTIKSIDALQGQVFDDIAKRVAAKINQYNPEN